MPLCLTKLTKHRQAYVHTQAKELQAACDLYNIWGKTYIKKCTHTAILRQWHGYGYGTAPRTRLSSAALWDLGIKLRLSCLHASASPHRAISAVLKGTNFIESSLTWLLRVCVNTVFTENWQ